MINSFLILSVAVRARFNFLPLGFWFGESLECRSVLVEEVISLETIFLYVRNPDLSRCIRWTMDVPASYWFLFVVLILRVELEVRFLAVACICLREVYVAGSYMSL